MHYYKRNIGDYAKKAGRLTMLQHGAYTLLLDACYDREVFPTLEQAIDWTWASTEAEVEAVKFVLNRFFKLDADGQYVQDRILEELLNYHKNAHTNKRIAQDREAKRREKSTKRGQAVDEPPPNQEPRTINQEPSLSVPNGTDRPSDDEPPKEQKFPGCNHKAVLSLYHSTLPNLPAIEVWNDLRSGLLRQRWREVCQDLAKQGPVTEEAVLDWWRKFFEFVGKSEFLTGKTLSKDKRPFLADLEWVIRPTNFAKVVEGKYHRS